MEFSVVMVGLAKAESPYIGEWIAYHEALGVTEFVLISNDCRQREYMHFRRAVSERSSAGSAARRHRAAPVSLAA